MTDAFNIGEAFHGIGLDPVPADAYKRLGSHWVEGGGEAAERLFDLNLGLYFDRLPSILDDRESAESVLLPYWADYLRTQHPRLSRLMRGMKRPERITKMELSAGMHESIMQEYYEWWVIMLNQRIQQDHRMRFADNSLSSEFNKALGVDAPDTYGLGDVSSFRITNVYGWAKTKQAQAVEPANQIIKWAASMLMRWCEKNKASLALRSPLAFAGPAFDDLILSQRPIHNTHGYLGKGASFALSMLNQLEAGLIPFHKDEPELLREEFNWWANHTVTARIEFHEGFYMGVAPAELPVLLLTRHADSLPVIGHKYETPMIHDQVIVWRELDPAIIEDPQYATKLVMDTNPDWPVVAETLALLVFCASIISCGIKLGSGHHKPYWIHTPLNPATIRVMLNGAPWTLKRMQSILGE